MSKLMESAALSTHYLFRSWKTQFIFAFCSSPGYAIVSPRNDSLAFLDRFVFQETVMIVASFSLEIVSSFQLELQAACL